MRGDENNPTMFFWKNYIFYDCTITYENGRSVPQEATPVALTTGVRKACVAVVKKATNQWVYYYYCASCDCYYRGDEGHDESFAHAKSKCEDPLRGFQCKCQEAGEWILQGPRKSKGHLKGSAGHS